MSTDNIVNLYKTVKVTIPEAIFNRIDWVKYLVIIELRKDIVNLNAYNAVTSEKFNKFVHDHVQAYIFEKKAPPKEIETAIMNIADDLLSGREPVLRAGDYIQLQSFMRG
jgi:hypothetical protein